VEVGVVFGREEGEVIGQGAGNVDPVAGWLGGDFEHGILRPGGGRRLQRTLDGEAGRQVIGYVVLHHFCVVHIDGGFPLVLSDEGMSGVRFEEDAGKEDVLARGCAEVSADFDDGHEIGVVVIEGEEVVEVRLDAVG
jgi:hypothetical protein